jgi:hypothetical protein
MGGIIGARTRLDGPPNVVFDIARSSKVRTMMNRRRKAAIGYATYVVGTRVAKRVARRKAQNMMSAARRTTRPRRRVIPVVGGAAAAIAGAAVLAKRHRGSDAAE